MNPILIIITAAAICVAVFFAISLKRLRAKFTTLSDEHTELETEHQHFQLLADNYDDEMNDAYWRGYNESSRTIEGLRGQIRRLNGFAFRLPIGPDVHAIQTPIGFVSMRHIGGYFGETAVFVYFPIGFGFHQELADAFKRATNGEFIMEPAPGASSGGDDTADAIITAGRDYPAYQRGEQGYFKDSPPPQLNMVADILSTIIVYPAGVTATS